MPSSARHPQTSPPISTAAFGVLGVVAEGRTHGFAVAGVFSADGQLGRVWRIPRPVVYRELGRLADAHLVHPVGVETEGPGPDRTVVEVTAAGRRRLDQWLHEPVPRARDARSSLLLKLALLHRADRDATALIGAQRELFVTRLAALRADVAAAAPDGFDRTIALWRQSATQAVVDFLDTLAGAP